MCFVEPPKPLQKYVTHTKLNQIPPIIFHPTILNKETDKKNISEIEIIYYQINNQICSDRPYALCRTNQASPKVRDQFAVVD